IHPCRMIGLLLLAEPRASLRQGGQDFTLGLCSRSLSGRRRPVQPGSYTRDAGSREGQPPRDSSRQNSEPEPGRQGTTGLRLVGGSRQGGRRRAGAAQGAYSDLLGMPRSSRRLFLLGFAVAVLLVADGVVAGVSASLLTPEADLVEAWLFVPALDAAEPFAL